MKHSRVADNYSLTRTIVFFYRFCTDLVADLITPPITSFLMDRHLWIPIVAAMGFQTLSVIMSTFLPETLPKLGHRDLRGSLEPSPIPSNTLERDDGTGKHNIILKLVRKINDLFGFLTHNTAVAILVPTFLISKVGRQAMNILFQYASIKYNWTLSQVNSSETLFLHL